MYTDADDVTVYGDNRFIAVFNKHPGGTLHLKECATYCDRISGVVFCDTDTIPLPSAEKSALFLTREDT